MRYVLASSGGSTIFAVVIVLFVIAAAYTVYSRSGSGIDAHPVSTDPDPGSGQEAGLQDPDREEFRETFDDLPAQTSADWQRSAAAPPRFAAGERGQE